MPLPSLPSRLSPGLHHFVMSVVFVLLFPLLPLLLELWKTHDVADTSTTLLAALFAVAVGSATTSGLLFALAIPISVGFSVVYGNILNNGAPPPPGMARGFEHCGGAALAAIALIFVYHLVERYQMHYKRNEPFLPCLAFLNAIHPPHPPPPNQHPPASNPPDNPLS